MQLTNGMVNRPRPAFLGLDEIVILEDVVKPVEQRVLSSWAQDQREAGRLLANPVDPATRSTPYLAAADRGLTPLTKARRDPRTAAPVWVPETSGRVLDPLPDEFWTIRDRVVDRLGIGNMPDDPYKGSFLTSVCTGGDVHTHKDARLLIADAEVPLLRCNVLVQRPDGGGNPVIEGVEIDIPDRGMWAFHPTENVHGATTVTGARSRVTLSFGFVVDPEPVWERPLQIAPGIEPDVLHGVQVQLRGQLMDPARADVLGLILDQTSTFCVREIASAMGVDTLVVWGETRRLIRLGLVRSQAPEPVVGGRTYIV